MCEGSENGNHSMSILRESQNDTTKQQPEREMMSESAQRSLALNLGDLSPEELDSRLRLYHAQFRRFGEKEDIEKAIECAARALELTPDGHPDLPSRHARLGVCYTDRFRRMGELPDLEKAIEHKSRALELTPDGHPDMPRRHANLGATYSDQFRHVGELEYLEKAVEHFSRALELTPDGHPDLPERHDNLGVSYLDRFRRLGELDYLEKAIKHHSQAIELSADGDPDLPGRHAALGVAYGDRYQRLNDLHDLEKTIEQFSRALELTPNDHPEFAGRHADLGVAYIDRYRRLGEVDDLEKAIRQHSCALKLTHDDHPDLARRHATLGVAYTERFELLGNPNDLEKMVEHDSCALELTPDDDPDLHDRYYNRAFAFLIQYRHTGDPSHMTNSLEYYRKASLLSAGAPRDVFQNAFKWAKRAAMHSFLNSLEAYQTTIDLLPQFIWLGATTAQRYQDLSTTESLAINAAHAAILESNPNLALEWLEHARCVVWNQTLMLRSPLEHLQLSHPDLALRIQSVSQQLQDAGSYSPSSQASGPDTADPEQIGLNRRRLAKTYNGLIAEARALPGFEDFLRPLNANQLVHAARNGPIVVINCHEERCDAILILPQSDQVRFIPLPEFSHKKALQARNDIRKSLSNQGIRQRGAQLDHDYEGEECFEDVLKMLWDDVVKPVLDSLGYTGETATDIHEMPHITWCPTGAISFLPLHAAGDYNQPHSRVFDYVISSYTPTVTALLSLPPSLLSPGSRVLGIGQEITHAPGYNLSKLPGTTKELDLMKKHTEKAEQIGFSELTGHKATKSAVLDAMEQHDWVHLACHAHQNVGDATTSGFFLHDGVLDLASINQRSFKNKGLAFLSACQTATGDENLPDEAVHLASGMLMAGYTSVIATMWSVHDDDAPLVADRVYAQLMNDGRLGNGEAGKALHNAVAELRDKVGEKDFGRWVPYIHIGS